jgi:hypothetical protein
MGNIDYSPALTRHPGEGRPSRKSLPAKASVENIIPEQVNTLPATRIIRARLTDFACSGTGSTDEWPWASHIYRH